MLARQETNGTVQNYLYNQGQQLASVGNAATPQIIDTIDPISTSYPGRTPTSYVINSGDSLQSIAQSVWGDGSMWYVIADANGLDANSILTIGDSLTIPNVVNSNRNNSTTFKPYDPTDIIGDTTPSSVSPPPPKPKKKKCGGVASVVMVVVAVVATIYTAGLAASILAPAAATAGASVGAVGVGVVAGGVGAAAGLTGGVVLASAGIGAIAGSIASQAIGKATGAVDKFSWSAVAAAGITGVAGAGFGLAASSGNFGATAAQAYMRSGTLGYATQGVFDYSVNYAANRVVGLDTAFSWQNVAASAIGAAVAGNLSTPTNMTGSVVRGISSAASSAYIRDKGFGGGKPDYAQVAADAFGNVLADYVVRGMAKPADEPAPFFQLNADELGPPELSKRLAPSMLIADIGNTGSDSQMYENGMTVNQVNRASGYGQAGLFTDETTNPGAFGLAADAYLAPLDIAASLATNMVVEPAIGMIGLATAVFTQDADSAGEFMQSLRDDWSYELKTDGARDLVGMLAPAGEWYGDLKTRLGDIGYELGGAWLGAAAYTAPDALLGLLGPISKGVSGTVGSGLSSVGKFGRFGDKLEGPGVSLEDARWNLDVEEAQLDLQTYSTTVGKNTAIWTLKDDGSPISVSGTLQESFKGAGRSSSEKAAQLELGTSGLEGDQGGHLIAHRFVLNQGRSNLFAQEKNFNLSAFSILENDYARWTAAGHRVDFLHTLGNFDAVTGRPDSVRVEYRVTSEGGDVIANHAQTFFNSGNQIYTRKAK